MERGRRSVGATVCPVPAQVPQGERWEVGRRTPDSTCDRSGVDPEGAGGGGAVGRGVGVSAGEVATPAAGDGVRRVGGGAEERVLLPGGGGGGAGGGGPRGEHAAGSVARAQQIPRTLQMERGAFRTRGQRSNASGCVRTSRRRCGVLRWWPCSACDRSARARWRGRSRPGGVARSTSSTSKTIATWRGRVSRWRRSSRKVALADLKLDRLVVVHAGAASFPLGDGIQAVAAARLLEDVDPL